MKPVRRITLIGIVLTAALTLAACGDTADDVASEGDTMSEEMSIDEVPAVTGGTVVEIAAATEGFGTLVAAINAAELVDTLNGPGPFTVFAPTDEAFLALPDGLLDALLLPENKETLAKILTYHVVPGSVLAADVMDGDVATVEGQTVALSTADGVTVNGAAVVQADVIADNGVIHAIDAVILPPDVDPAALLAG